MPLQVSAGEPVCLLGLGVRGLTRVTVGDEPHVVQGFRVHLGCPGRAALVAGGPADGRVEGMVRAGALALRTVEQAGRPAGVGHGLEEEGIEKHKRIAVLELVKDLHARVVEIGVPGGICGGEALG